MKMSRKSLMKHANHIAREIVSKTENYSIALSWALKYCWKKIRESYNEKTHFTKRSVKSAVYQLTHKPYDHKWDTTCGIYDFFLAEERDNGDLGCQEYQAINAGLVDSYGPERETAKAVDIRFSTPFGNIYLWVPRAMTSEFRK